MDLVIMAAGIGSRFGGLKQLQPIDDNNNFIIDYSIYDAIRVGFDHVVFIIKKEFYDEFKETIGNRIAKYIDVDYVFQGNDVAVGDYKIPEDRIRPLGTGHAILCAKPYIKSDFAVINADDFYGSDAFKVAKEFLESKRDNKYATIGYKAKNTMTENGSVKRGVIKEEDNNLKSIIESKLEYKDGKIIASPLDGSTSFEVSEDALVSMNMLTFDLSIFDFIKERMDIFFKENENNLDTCEFLIPTELNYAIEQGKEVKVLSTNATWQGVTYKEDTPKVKEAIKKLVLDNEYPNDLWN